MCFAPPRRAKVASLCTPICSGSQCWVNPSTSKLSRGAVVRDWSVRAKKCTVSPSYICVGTGDCHSVSPPHSTFKLMACAQRIRRNMRMIAAEMSSLGETNSHAPPVASAKSRKRLSAGELPTPIAKMRCPCLVALLTMASTSHTSPSVMSRTPGLVKATLGTSMFLKVDTNASRKLVPPISASVWRMAEATKATVAGVQARRLLSSCRTASPNRL